MTMRRLVILLSLLVPLCGWAQVDRTTLFGVGRGNVMDTYLSPYTYKGPAVSVALQTERLAHWGRNHVTTQSRYALQGALASAHAGGGMQYDGALELAGGWHRNWYFCSERLRVAAGGLMELWGGGSYSSIGGNNPAQGRLGADVAASAIGAYRFPVRKQVWESRLQIDVPLLGAAFAPQYGQSYYELFTLGHYDRNVRPVCPINAPSVRLQATLSIPVRHSRFVVGYNASIRQHTLNGLRQHGWYNQFVVGFSRRLNLTR